MSSRSGRPSTLWFCARLSCFAATASRADATHPDPLYRDLDVHSRVLAEEAVQLALEKVVRKRTHQWHDGASGSFGMVTPQRTFRIKSGQYCREYTEVVYSSGGPNSGVRVACRDDEGTWIPMDR